MLSGNSTVSNVEVGLGKPNFMLERPSWNTCVSIYRYSIPFLPSSFSMPLRNSNARANPLFTTLIILKLTHSLYAHATFNLEFSRGN